MMRFKLGLVLVLVPACLTESPIAQQQLSADEQLRASIGPFCDDACSRQVACQIATEDDCSEQCRGYMAAFVGNGDDCLKLGQGIEDCVGGLKKTCDAVATFESCDVSTDVHDACAASGPGGATNGEETDQPSVGPPVACDSQDTGRGPTAPSGYPKATSCELGATQCSDGAEYLVTCSLVETTNVMVCNCFKDGIATDAPSWTPAGDCPIDAEANGPCGWNVMW